MHSFTVFVGAYFNHNLAEAKGIAVGEDVAFSVASWVHSCVTEFEITKSAGSFVRGKYGWPFTLSKYIKRK